MTAAPIPRRVPALFLLAALAPLASAPAAPPQPESPAARARTLAAAGRLEAAIELLETEAANDPQALVALAGLLTRADRIAEAEATLARVLATAPDATPLAVTRASLLFRLHRYREAKEVLDAILARTRDHPFAHYFLGAIALRLDDPETAAQHAERAVAAFPRGARPAHSDPLADALDLLGQARLELGDHAAGEGALREALRIQPHRPGARYLLAQSLLEREGVEDGMVEQEIFAAARAASEAVGLGTSLLGDSAAAEAEFRRALRIWPDHPLALLALANLLEATDREAEAADLRLRLDPGR